jgi:hypothetical protein
MIDEDDCGAVGGMKIYWGRMLSNGSSSPV